MRSPGEMRVAQSDWGENWIAWAVCRIGRERGVLPFRHEVCEPANRDLAGQLIGAANDYKREVVANERVDDIGFVADDGFGAQPHDGPHRSMPR